MASIFASESRLHGGSFDMLELETVLHREACDWLLPCLLIAFFLGVRGASSASSDMALPPEARKQLSRIAVVVGWSRRLQHERRSSVYKWAERLLTAGEGQG